MYPAAPQSSATIAANNSHLVLNTTANGAPLDSTISALNLTLHEASCAVA